MHCLPNFQYKRTSRRARLTGAALAALAGLLAGPVCAETSPWYVGAALGYSHDSNVFRLPDSLASSTGTSQGDRITSATLLGGLDQSIGRQRLHGSATLRDNRFAHHRALDNTGYGLRLGLDWSTVERLSGNLNLQANRELAFLNPDSGVPTLSRANIARSSQVDGKLR